MKRENVSRKLWQNMRVKIEENEKCECQMIRRMKGTLDSQADAHFGEDPIRSHYEMGYLRSLVRHQITLDRLLIQVRQVGGLHLQKESVNSSASHFQIVESQQKTNYPVTACRF